MAYNNRYLDKSEEEIFMSYVKKDDNSGCWIWSGSIRNDGYGRIMFNAKVYGAHRWSYMHWKGEITTPQVNHLCNNTLCVNPEHLVLGDAKENRIYAFKCNRVSHQGERNPAHKLTIDEVNRIKEEYSNGGISMGKLGQKFNVSAVTIFNVIRGKTYVRD